MPVCNLYACPQPVSKGATSPFPVTFLSNKMEALIGALDFRRYHLLSGDEGYTDHADR